MGGLANPTPKHEAGNLKIGPAGVPYKQEGKKISFVHAIQHGHLYARWDDFGCRLMRNLSLTDNNTSMPAIKDPQQTMAADYISDLSRKLGLDQGQSWDALEAPLDTTEELQDELNKGSQQQLDEDRLAQLLLYAKERNELVMEKNLAGRLRCRGLLVFLTIEADVGGKQLILVHEGAQATEIGHGDLPEGDVPAFVEDARVVAILCKHHSLWMPHVMQYIQDSFHLTDAALERICQGLSEQAYAARNGPLPTVCHHHQAACNQRIDLTYDSLYLTTNISAKDTCFPDKFVGPNVTKVTSEERAFVNGISNSPPQQVKGNIRREWAWLTREEARARGVRVSEPPPGAKPLKLLSQEINVASLLIGIETCAPRKEGLLGHKHTTSAKPNEYSAFGRRKWKDFRNSGIRVPAENGGVQVLVTKSNFEEFVERCRELQLCVPSCPSSENGRNLSERQLFQQLLQACASQTRGILEEHCNKEQSTSNKKGKGMLPSFTARLMTPS